jgi:hypothetical protein
MPFFSYPAPADWLLPIIKLPLTLVSLVFSFIGMIGPWGNVALVTIIIALFTRNIMGPART